jgi:PAS domain S-box-containing protein
MMDTKPSIMILDDELGIRQTLSIRLQRLGYTVYTAKTYDEYTRLMSDVDVVFCDIVLTTVSGLDALKWTRHYYPNSPVVMITAKPSLESAIEAVRLGAFDYLTKPINFTLMQLTLDRAVQHRRLLLDKIRLEKENEAYRTRLEGRVVEQTLALRESQESLKVLTNTMADAVFSLSIPDYQILYTNQAVFDIFGYQPQELEGQAFARLYGSQKYFSLFSAKQVAAIAAGHTQMRIELPLLKKDGSPVITEIVSTFVYGVEGELERMISVVRDITQRSFLLGVVAHELRGPLSLVAGFAEALHEVGDLDSAQLTKYLSIINNNTTHVLRMLNELLDVTQIELGSVSLKIEPVNLANLIQSLHTDYSFMAEKKGIALTSKLAEEALFCRCDKTKIGQVIANFIDNAIKYSHANSTIEISGKLKSKSVWVGVKDEGLGIKPEEFQYLFKGFGHNKISSRPTGGEKSTGLGLIICKNIIDAHGGEIGVESVPNHGSTFWFLLPLNSSIDAPAR